MANTLIQLKSSTSNASPSSLNVAEPAYSYVSNTLFIGTAGGDGVFRRTYDVRERIADVVERPVEIVRGAYCIDFTQWDGKLYPHLQKGRTVSVPRSSGGVEHDWEIEYRGAVLYHMACTTLGCL